MSHNGILNIHENANMTNEYLSHSMELKTYKIFKIQLSFTWAIAWSMVCYIPKQID